jgi:hypothetical protein
MIGYDFFKEASNILAESDDSVRLQDVRAVLEDTQSPVTNKYIENLYEQIVKKSHVDFDNIPQSKGKITSYRGYATMMETLNTLKTLSSEERNSDADGSIDTILTAIGNIKNLSDLYEEGYRQKNEYVMLEYNTFVFCCVEATTAVLSEYVEFIKGFDLEGFKLKLKNSKYKANALYIDNLKKFNNIVASSNYRTYLSSMLNTERDNFIGATTVGIATVAATVVVAIVPVTRELIYQFYRLRSKLSDALMLQAYFLELNKACVEANKEFSTEKKSKILKKQEYTRALFIRLADKIKVANAHAERDSASDRKKDNATLTLGDTRHDVDSSSYDVLL